MTMKTLRLVHRWFGLVLALLLLLISLTGAVVAFRGDLVRIEFAAARGPAPDPASFGRALDAFAAGNDVAIKSAKFAPYGTALHMVYLDGGATARIDAGGKVIAMGPAAASIGDWLLRLHKTLLAGETGETVIGIIGIAAFGMIVTGLFLYWPLRRGFRWQLWPKNWRRPALLFSHRNLGLLLALPLAVQFASGSAMVFDRPLARLLAVPKPAEVPRGAAADATPFATTLAAAQAAVPAGAIRAVSTPRQPGAPFTVRLQQPGDLNPEGATRVLVAGGTVVQVVNPAAQGFAAQALASLLGIHMLSYVGGVASQLLLAALGLALASLVLFGALSWLRSRPA
ncbi:MAG: PepSY-associated TM helix domain-containing protein [Polymorphobacter sp.]